MTWPLVPLGELSENFDSMRIPVKEAERSSGPYPYYGASGIVDHVDRYLFDGEYVLVAEDGENLRTRQTPIAFLARGKFWVNNHAHILRARAPHDSYFLMYALRAADVRAFLTGSTMPKLTQANLNRIPVLNPPPDVQRRIGEIIRALDDKIDVNRRTNETLEAMASALFKSWFVDFDPVHAHAAGTEPSGMDASLAGLFPRSFDSTVAGDVPSKWTMTSLMHVIEILDSRRIPLSAREREQRRGRYPYYGATSIMDHVDDYLFDGIHVLVGEDGSVVRTDGTPFVQYVWGQFWVNNHAHVLRGTGPVSSEHLYLALTNSNIAGLVTGAVQAKLNQANLGQIPFLLPSDDVANAFSALLKPIFHQIRSRSDQTATLQTLRDALLPKLLSGEISVPEAERIVGKAV